VDSGTGSSAIGATSVYFVSAIVVYGEGIEQAGGVPRVQFHQTPLRKRYVDEVLCTETEQVICSFENIQPSQLYKCKR